MEHIGFITKKTAKYTLIWDKMYQVPLPGGRKVRVTLGALRKAGWKIEPWEHATPTPKPNDVTPHSVSVQNVCKAPSVSA